MIRRLIYALRLAFTKSDHISFHIRETGEGQKLAVMAQINDEDTLLLLLPSFQQLIDRAYGIDPWDIN